jgi:protein-S-isoprenylcysteine O-methyltransferase Ste14
MAARCRCRNRALATGRAIRGIIKSMMRFRERGGWWVVAQLPVLVLAAVLPPLATPPALHPLLHPLRLVGMTLLAGGVVLVLAAARALGQSLTPYPQPRYRGELRAHGLYAWVRHPMYAGLVLAAFGWALVWQSAIGVLYAIPMFVFFDRKAAREEQFMRARFAGYSAYAQRVRRFIPGIY